MEKIQKYRIKVETIGGVSFGELEPSADGNFYLCSDIDPLLVEKSSTEDGFSGKVLDCTGILPDAVKGKSDAA